MLRFLKWLGGIVVVLVALNVWMFWPVRLPVPPLSAAMILPAADPPPG